MNDSNLILNAMFNAMPDSVFCKNLERRYIECNNSFELFMSRNKDEIIGKTFAEVTERGLDIVKHYSDVDTTVINEGKTVTQEGVLLTYNGSDRFYDLIKTPLIRKNADGEDEVFGLLGIMHDVNNRYLLIKDLQDMQANLEMALEQANSANRAKSEFLSRMSHELLTPMNAIMGLSQIMKVSRDVENIKSCIGEIYDNSCHLLRLITNLLEVSSGTRTLNESTFQPYALINNLKSRIEPYLKRKQQILNIECGELLPKELIADEKRIEKVIFHLLTNASKFSHEKDEITLKLSLLEEAGERTKLGVSVVDNGIGMSPEVLSIIFDIFEQGDGSSKRKHQGVGIGLTIAKYTVETMGGVFTVVSEPGKGSDFTFEVPVTLCNP
jgi:signal transduction histidine kinase